MTSVTKEPCRVLREISTGIQSTTTLYIMLLVAVVVTVDVLFFRSRFWKRLIANIGVVLVFALFYFRFLKQA
jgi:hypothetical protein